MDITASDRERMVHTVERLTDSIGFIRACVEENQFAFKYEALVDLMERQKTALTNLLEGLELGCEPDSLAYDAKTMLVDQHMQNLAVEALKVKHLATEEEKDVVFQPKGVQLHEIKDKAVVAQFVLPQVKRLTQGMTRHIGEDNSQGRNVA